MFVDMFVRRETTPSCLYTCCPFNRRFGPARPGRRTCRAVAGSVAISDDKPSGLRVRLGYGAVRRRQCYVPIMLARLQGDQMWDWIAQSSVLCV